MLLAMLLASTTVPAAQAADTATRDDYDQFVMADLIVRLGEEDLHVEPQATPGFTAAAQLSPSWLVGLSLELTQPQGTGGSLQSRLGPDSSYETWVYENSKVVVAPLRPEVSVELAPWGDVSTGLHLGAGFSMRRAEYRETRGWLLGDTPDEDRWDDARQLRMLSGGLSAGARTVVHPGLALGIDLGVRVQGFAPALGPIELFEGDVNKELALLQPVLVVSGGWGRSPDLPPSPWVPLTRRQKRIAWIAGGSVATVAFAAVLVPELLIHPD